MKEKLVFTAKFFGVGCISSLVLLFVGLVVLFKFGDNSEYSLNGVRCLEIDNEIDYFQESSEFDFPDGAEIILSCDDHSGFHWDGEYYFVFDTTPQQAMTYLDSTPWDADWQQGPVPEDVYDNLGLASWANEQFKSPDIWYLAENNSPPNTSVYEKWWNGRVLLVEPATGRVFYSK